MSRRGLLVVLVGALMASACTVVTQEDAATSTTAPPTTAPASTTTLPPELQPPGLKDVSVGLEQMANYSVPLTLIATQTGSDSVFVGSRNGAIYEIRRDARRNLQTGVTTYTVRPNTSPFADISSQVSTEGDDWGLHGFAFSTDGTRLYVSFTNTEGRTATSELRVSNGRVSPTSQRPLLEPIENRDDNHNAGPIAIGADGFLHIPLGDGGGSGDPFDLAQDPAAPQGKVLRIDPETGGANNYNVPLGNPYRGSPSLVTQTVYLSGLRDPRSLWFDPVTRDMWLTDAGEDGVQEINLVPWDGAPITAGNFGWPLMNGTEEFEGEAPEDYLGPISTYGPDQGCGVVGGAVYHGRNIPGLEGAYVFGDYCTGRLIAVKVEEGEVTDYRILPVTVPPETLSAIGTAPDGEIWLITWDGTNALVQQLVYVPPPPDPVPTP